MKGDEGMTIEETLKDMLIQNGMFENQADAVLDEVEAEASEMIAEAGRRNPSKYLQEISTYFWTKAEG